VVREEGFLFFGSWRTALLGWDLTETHRICFIGLDESTGKSNTGRKEFGRGLEHHGQRGEVQAEAGELGRHDQW
jgi:hypothetical protein